MPKHSKHRSPPCDCLNKVESVSDSIQSGSCEHCNGGYRDSVCAYVAHFECNYYSQNATRERIAEPCVVLRKDCILGCTYSSRWACPSSNPIQDTQVLQWDGCTLLGNPAAALSCAGCEQLTGCITGVITALTLPTDANNTCPVLNGAEDPPIDIALRYYGNQVVTESTGVPPLNEPVYPNSCMWSGTAIVRNTGMEMYRMPLFLDRFEDGSWRMRIYIRVNFSGGFETACSGPENLEDLRLNFARYDIDLPYLDCDLSTFTDIDHTDGEFHVTITDWAVQNPCPVFPQIALPGGCTWGQATCAGDDTCDQSQEAQVPYDDYADAVDSCYTKWRMTITSETTAELDLLTREGYFAHYVCNDFQCRARSTFKRHGTAYDAATNPDGNYSPETIGLPPCVCVSPLSFIDSICNESGFDTCCDSGGTTLPVHINSVRVCPDGDPILEDEWVDFIRGIDLPCGVPNPTPYNPCLYFGTYITSDQDCAEWGPSLFVLMMCGRYAEEYGFSSPPGTCATVDGQEQYYAFKVYCLNADTGCYEEAAAYDVCYVCQCQGPDPADLTIEVDCCCPVTCGCDPTPPTTLYADDGTTVAELTWVGPDYWAGTAPSGFAGCLNDPVGIELICNGGSTYTLQMEADVCDSSDADDCDPFSITFAPSGCCGGLAAGTVTVTE